MDTNLKTIEKTMDTKTKTMEKEQWIPKLKQWKKNNGKQWLLDNSRVSTCRKCGNGLKIGHPRKW